ncbi:SDR family oxidoreductase [Pseudarthrobacter sp. N5]|uniref:SDR family oxidoreductase n=1 Tax=Pseudarthrobacter sp. N5 TaxID=3418416 RepID=UPI003CF79714
MDDVLVTGGTGHLGTDIVRLLVERGDRVRVLSRMPGTDPDVLGIQGDLATGSGIREAVTGVRTIVHAATLSPAAQRGYFRPVDFVRSPPDVDVDGTRRLLDEAARAGVEHFLHVSIVGVQQSRIPYLRRKAEAENLVRGSAIPWSIVPATPFFWLLARLHDHMAGKRVWLLPSNLAVQPGDSADFAPYVVESVSGGPGGDRTCFAGPEVLSQSDVALQYQSARGIQRRIVGLRLPGFALQASGPQTCPAGRRGTTTWAEWLAQH